MNKNIKRAIKQNLKKYFNDYYYKSKFWFSKYYDNNEVIENTILFQSYDGDSITDSPFYLLKEISENENYKSMKKYVAIKKHLIERTNQYLLNYNINDVELVVPNTKQYCKILATAKYLVNNSTFPTYFIKKKEQIYLNTWHGTPLKHMGKDINYSATELGNVQRNFIMSDYLLYPNDYMFNIMREGYMLNNLFKNKYILGGYPRNDIFFNNDRRKEIREKLNLTDKKIAIYMPTWRGSLNDKSNYEQYIQTMALLFEIDKKLDNDTILYVKLHNFVNKEINYKYFSKIKPFPNEYETYEFLNISDVLITDFSSVFFDYANTGRKIILFAKDIDEYCENRGMYINYKALPFTFATDVDTLVNEIEKCNDYTKYKKFNSEFNNHDCKNASKYICNLLFQNKSNNLQVIDGKKYCNGKKNILIYTGGLLKNGITTALKGLINNTNRDEYNYFLTFYKFSVENNKADLSIFNNIEYIPIHGYKDLTIKEAACHLLYYRFNINNKIINKNLKRMYEREAQRVYCNNNFDYLIHYSGYEKHIIHLFDSMEGKKVIFTHSDLMKEHKTRDNIHMNSLAIAHNNFDMVAVVRDTMKDDIIRDFHINAKKVYVVHNINDIERIINGSKMPVTFDSNTYCNKELNEINEILDNKKYKKFINIARFSPEKGLDRLVNAFNKFSIKNKNYYLFLIGGEGPEFKNILNLSEQNDRIVIIKSLSNPYSILGKCDLFVLSSYYEGLPMTVMESLILKKQILSVDIDGPRKFLSQGYAHLVEDSENGLLTGFEDYHNNKFNKLKEFNAKEFNKKAITEYENMLKENQ